MTPHVQAADGVETIDKFCSMAAWYDAIGWCLDAPRYVARGGIESVDLGGGPVFFASEVRP